MTVEDIFYVVGLKTVELEQVRAELNATKKNLDDVSKQLAEALKKIPSQDEAKPALTLVPKEGA